jgi:subtilisin family serine protease/fibronectin type 3 domain-containing protein
MLYRPPLRRLALSLRPWLLSAGIAAGLTCVHASAPAAVAPKPYAPDHVLVAFKPGAAPAVRSAAAARVGLQPDATFRSRHLARLALTPAARAAGVDVSSAVAALRRDPAVRLAEPDYIVRAAAVPNDPLFQAEWGLHNTGQSGGTPDADVDAPEAWDATTGRDQVIVAVIDTGIDHTHPDLLDNVLRTAGGAIVGFDYANNDADPMDDNDHGTHVAGIIGAAGNNARGIAGVCWDVSLMPLKFLDSTGAGETSAAIQCIDFAIQNGAKILNLSWGGGPDDPLLLEAIRRARTAGLLVVAAAGNDAQNNDAFPFYPASYNAQADNVLSVAATTDRDALAEFSNFGAGSVDLAAPGDNTMSTALGGVYASYGGTSAAAAHVSGAAALILSRFASTTYAQVRTRLFSGADHPSALAGRVATGRLNVKQGLEQDQVAPDAPGVLVATDGAAHALLFQWVAPGDDGASGAAARYDFRFSQAPITSANFDAALPASGLPTPSTAGTLDRFLLAGLSPGASYYAAVRAIDNVGNASTIAVTGPVVTPASSLYAALLLDDVEGAGQFSGAPWTISTEQAASPSHAYSDSAGGLYGSSLDAVLTQTTGAVVTGLSPSLLFKVKTDLEDEFDFLYVEVSADDGATWKRIGPELTGTRDWTTYSLSLASYYGRTVRVRFRLMTDADEVRDGAWIDDVELSGELLRTLPPVPPGNLHSTSVAQTEIGLEWQDNSPNETGFELERKTGGGQFILQGRLPAGTTSYADTDLQPATAYTYRVRALNDAGRSAFSNELAVRTLRLPPDPPTDLQAAVGRSGVSLAWQDNSEEEEAYEVERKKGDGEFARIQTLAASATSTTDTTVEEDTSYTYRVRATNDGGGSAYTNAVTVLTLPALPKAPTELKLTVPGTTEIDLAWKDNSTNESGFEVQRRDPGADYATIATTGANVAGYADTGLPSGVTYSYRVRAINRAGASSYCAAVEGSTKPGPPAPPAAFTVRPDGQKTLRLEWTDDNPLVDHFEIERKQSDGGFSQIATPAAEARSFTERSLSAATTYSYRIRTISLGGTSDYATADGTTLPAAPRPPATFTADGCISHVVLSWTHDGRNATGFRIERKEGGGAFALLASPGAAVREYDDAAVSAGKTYTYKVAATGDGGTSRFTAPATVTLPALAPKAKLLVTPASLAFGKVKVRKKKRLAFTVRNGGKGTLTVCIEAVAAPFSTSAERSSFTLAAGNSRTVTVQFAPKKRGAARASVAVRSTDPKRALVNVTLTGTGR